MEYLPIREVSTKVGLSPHRIRELARLGEIEARRLGQKRWLVAVAPKDKTYELVYKTEGEVALTQTEREEAESSVRLEVRTRSLEKHFDDICQLIQKWRDQIYPKGEYAPPPVLASFRADEAKLGHEYERGALHWLVGHDGTATVWLDAENDPLFKALKNHLPDGELWDDYTELKSILRKEIQSALESDRLEQRELYGIGLKELMSRIDTQLETAALKGVFSSTCDYCPDKPD